MRTYKAVLRGKERYAGKDHYLETVIVEGKDLVDAHDRALKNGQKIWRGQKVRISAIEEIEERVIPNQS